MSELHLQDKFLVPFMKSELGYREVKPNTVTNSLIIEEDLQEFISQTTLNQKPYETLLRKYNGNTQDLLADLIELIQERIASSRNMALFINANKSVTLRGVKLYLFYTDDSVIHGSELFKQNIFSVIQELPYQCSYKGKKVKRLFPSVLTSHSLSMVSIWVTANSKSTLATKPLRIMDGAKSLKTILKQSESITKPLIKTLTSAMPKKFTTAKTSSKSLKRRSILPPPTLPKPTLFAPSINSLTKL